MLALLVYLGALGLSSRTGRRGATRNRSRHTRWTPFMYAAVLFTWATGAGSTWLGRADLVFSASLHFRTGALLVAMLTGSAVTAWLMARGRHGARDWHPWFGAAALLLAAAHAVAGLRLMP